MRIGRTLSHPDRKNAAVLDPVNRWLRYFCQAAKIFRCRRQEAALLTGSVRGSEGISGGTEERRFSPLAFGASRTKELGLRKGRGSLDRPGACGEETPSGSVLKGSGLLPPPAEPPERPVGASQRLGEDVSPIEAGRRVCYRPSSSLLHTVTSRTDFRASAWR